MTLRNPSILLALTAVVLLCATAPALAQDADAGPDDDVPAETPAETTPPAGPRAADTQAPLVVEPLSTVTVAPAAHLALIEEAPETPLLDGKRERTVVARGARTAIVRVGDDLWLALDHETGVLGRLAVPVDTTWVSIAGDEQVVAVTSGGRLYTARDPRDALREDGFERRVELDAALTGWDVTPTAIVGCHDAAVTVVDLATGVATATAPELADGTHLEDCERVLARADGVLVVLGKARAPSLADELPGASDADDASIEDAVWILGPKGRWRVEPRGERDLTRAGQWIMERWGAQGPVVLATDASWTDQVDEARLHELYEIARATRFSPWPGGSFGDIALTLLEPAAPLPASALTEPVTQGELPPGMVGALMGNTLAAPACAGAQCFDARTAAVSRYEFGFLHDGRCPARPLDELYPPPPADPNVAMVPIPECEVDAMTRLPHVGIVDRQTGALDVVGLPEACPVPLEVHGAGGLGLLFCASDDPQEVRVFTRTPRSRWADEGVLPAAGIGLHAASGRAPSITVDETDGTVLLRDAACSQTARCAGWVRTPAAPGAADVWSPVAASQGAASDVVGYRLTGGGSALVVSASGPSSADVGWSLPDGQPGPVLVQGLQLDGHALYDVRIEDTCLLAEVDAAPSDAEERAPARREWRVVGAQGQLLDTSRCADAIENHARLDRMGWLRVRCNEPGATVIVDGEGFEADRLRCPLDVEVDPGTYEVFVAAADHDPWRSQIEVPVQGDVTLEAELFSIPFIDVRAFGGIGLDIASDSNVVPVFLTEIAISIAENRYEVVPFFRLGIGNDEREHGYMGGVAGRVMWRWDSWDVGVGGGLGFGNLEGKLKGEKDTPHSVLTLRYMLGAMGGLRFGPANVRLMMNFYPSDPHVFEAITGLGIGF